MFGMTKRSRVGDAVITGAGSGIGAAFAVELADRGNRVICSDIDAAAVQRTVETIHDQGGTAIAVRCDVSGSTRSTTLPPKHSRGSTGRPPW